MSASFISHLVTALLSFSAGVVTTILVRRNNQTKVDSLLARINKK